MRSVEDLEHYLIRLGMPYREVGDSTWVIQDEYDQIDNIVVKWSPPLVIFRVKLMDVDGADQAALFRKLLELNASQMVHGAFGIEGNSVVVVDTLQAENLDYNEFMASVDSLTMAITTHYKELALYRKD
ncbi:MAG TPA: YbjN domain-containing protein [Myxococcota bacterium]|jgi:hypothetical protein|nr:YbjN domain-containing protein [Myxococcota bacterium]